jgi:hypothetical protein
VIAYGGGGGGGGFQGGDGGDGYGIYVPWDGPWRGPYGAGGGLGGTSYVTPDALLSWIQPGADGGGAGGNGVVDIAFTPSPSPGAGLLSLTFFVLAGVWSKARGFLAR